MKSGTEKERKRVQDKKVKNRVHDVMDESLSLVTI
jgi:hypothetical protein